MSMAFPLEEPYYASDVVLMAEVSLHGKFAEIPKALYFRRMEKTFADVV